MEFKWIISAMDCAPQTDGLTDVVKAVHWRRIFTDGEYTVDIYGVCEVGSPTPEHFVSYQDLTKEEVEGWLEVALDVPKISEQLIILMENARFPEIITLPPPFQNEQQAVVEDIPTEGIVE